MKENSPIPEDAFLIVIGAMKCGTSSFFDYLARQPAICASSIKEPGYFCKLHHNKLIHEKYESLWSFDRRTHRYAMEASTGYTKANELDAARAMRDYGLRPKFIYLVRDPIARIESHYNYMRRLSLKWKSRIDSDYLLNTSKYFMQAEKFANEFDRKSICVLRFEDFVAYDHNMQKTLWEFLELPPPAAGATAPARNITTDIPSRSAQQLRRAVPATWARGIPGPVKQAVRSLDRRLAGKRTARLSTLQRDEIRRRLEGDMAALAETYGVDTAAWGF